MKRIFLAVLFLIMTCNCFAQIKGTNTALLIIDMQNFYFPGGKSELVNPEGASLNAQKVLQKSREDKMLVIHVRHNFEPGGEIHVNVKPIEGEKVISKDAVNSFWGTDLLEYLKANQISKLVICGMQTHMCVEGAVRAAKDLGFNCTLISDACATRNLKYGDKVISAEDVHYSTLSTLNKIYANVVDTQTFLESIK